MVGVRALRVGAHCRTRIWGREEGGGGGGGGHMVRALWVRAMCEAHGVVNPVLPPPPVRHPPPTRLQHVRDGGSLRAPCPRGTHSPARSIAHMEPQHAQHAAARLGTHSTCGMATLPSAMPARKA